METFYIDRYEIEINLTPETKAGESVECFIKLRDMNDCPESDKKMSHYVWGYRAIRLVDDTAIDLARRVFTHYKMGTEPDSKFPVEEKMTAAQIRGSIQVNESAWEQASKTLRELLDESKPHRPYYTDRLISQLNLCSEIVKDRARLEYELQKAVQSGR